MKIIDIPRSGSQASTTSSRNRNGQYTRNRRSPVQPRTPAQLAVRANMASNAAAWRTLTDAQRAGWATLGTSMTRTDSLGQTYNLTGLQAYNSVNNLKLLVGDATVTDAPALVTPTGVETVVITATSGGTPALSIAFTPTPIGSTNRVIIRASKQRSAGVSFEHDFRVITSSAANAASPTNILAAYTAKFGALVSTKKIFVSVSVYSLGFESVPFIASKIVT